MINTAVLRRAHVARDFLNTVWQRARSGSKTRSGRPCPYCHAPMTLVAVSTGRTHLSLDVCLGCSCIWFDPGEYQATPMDCVVEPDGPPLFATQKERKRAPPPKTEPPRHPPPRSHSTTSLESLLDALASTTKTATRRTRSEPPKPARRKEPSAPAREPSPKSIDIKPSPGHKPLRPKRQAAKRDTRSLTSAVEPAIKVARAVTRAVPEVRRPKRPDPPRPSIDYNRSAYRTGAAHHGNESSAPDFLVGLLGLPVEDGKKQPTKTRPWLTWGTVALLAIVYLASGDSLGQMIERWGFLPEEWWRWGFVPVFTCFFIHASFWHLFSNAYFLVTFGDNVEDHLGMRRYFWLLVFAHVAGVVAHGVFDPRGALPLVGASAGISGVIAFYAVAFPRAKIKFLVLYKWVRINAIKALALWAGLQLLTALAQNGGAGSVSAYGHLGGAAVGVLAGLFLQRGRKSALEADRFRRGTEYGARWSPEDVRVHVPTKGYLRTELQVRSCWQQYLDAKRGA